MLLKTAMRFNFSSPKYFSLHKRRKIWVSPVSRASLAHMNSPLKTARKSNSDKAGRIVDILEITQQTVYEKLKGYK